MKKKLSIIALIIAIMITAISSYAAVSAASYTLGDANYDGKTTIKDVTKVQRYIAGTATIKGNAYYAADVNGDGVIDISDATLIQKYVVKLIDRFPADKSEPTTTMPQPTTDSDGYNNIVVKP